MKLEVGMYVRTKHNGIKQINALYSQAIFTDTFIRIENEQIINASHNIIDLIEVGDVVELFMEYDIDKEDTNIFELVAITDDKKEIGVFNSDFQIEFFPIENLRGIVTKEMFESISYKIGD